MTRMMRLKPLQIAPIRAKMTKKQKNLCAICRKLLVNPVSMKADSCLDHCHVTGNVREVLCRNCNGIEGKIFNLANRAKRGSTPHLWLELLLAYWKKHADNPSGVYHPTHKTEDEKRILRNGKARKRRAVKKK